MKKIYVYGSFEGLFNFLRQNFSNHKIECILNGINDFRFYFIADCQYCLIVIKEFIEIIVLDMILKNKEVSFIFLLTKFNCVKEFYRSHPRIIFLDYTD